MLLIDLLIVISCEEIPCAVPCAADIDTPETIAVSFGAFAVP